MKKMIVVIALMLTMVVGLNAQGFGWGIKGGISSSTISIEGFPASTEAKSGAVAGAFLVFDVVFLDIQVDALYAQKGSKIDGEEITLNYLSIPAVAKFHFLPVISPYIGAGLEYSYLLGVEAPFGISTDDFETSDMGAIVALGVDFALVAVDLYVDARYVFSLSNIAKDIPGVEFKNNTWQITVGVSF